MIWTTRPRSELNGLSAICAGAGPLVVLLHGVGLCADAWNAQIDFLVENGFRVCAPDMPGHGDSPLGRAPGNIAAYADRLAPVLTAPAVVVGHSMGAMIAVELAHRSNSLVTGVVALNGIYQRSATAKQAVRDRADALDGRAAPDPEGTLARWFGTVSTPERDACARWLRAVDPAGYKAAYSVFAILGSGLEVLLWGFVLLGAGVPVFFLGRQRAAFRLCSIFMASNTARVWSASTTSPSFTRTDFTSPGIGAVIAPAARPPPSSTAKGSIRGNR